MAEPVGGTPARLRRWPWFAVTLRRWLGPGITAGAILLAAGSVKAETALPGFDFTSAAGRVGWQAAHDIASLKVSPEGYRITVNGDDPYLIGPARDYPPGKPLWLHVRLKSRQAGTGQVFYFRRTATEADSVRFPVLAGRWCKVKLRLPALGTGYHIRVDPPGSAGNVCILASVTFDVREHFRPPVWPQPMAVAPAVGAATLRSGDLELTYGRRALGDFVVAVAGRRMACGNPGGMIGYLHDGEPRWVPIGAIGRTAVRVTHRFAGRVFGRDGFPSLLAKATFTDPDGAHWQINQTFRPTAKDSVRVDLRVMVDRNREVLYLPLFTLLPGVGSFGTNKTQALFAGLEYLANEPSSSTADLNAPASNRQVPDMAKLTFPLMVVSADQRYVGLAWNRAQNSNVCAVFDSPDRFFHSGGHLLELLFPGSDGEDRDADRLIPYSPVRLHGGQGLRLTAWLIGGRGATVVPAVRQCVRLFGLPPLPDPGMSAEAYFRLAAHGWLDSAIRDGNRYRHAAWPGFGPGPSADAAWTMDWLAEKVGDPTLAKRLRLAARNALTEVAPAAYNAAQLGHIRYPLPALVFGAVAENADTARDQARALLRRFGPDGSIEYKQAPGKPDFARTHWSREANGLTAQVVGAALEQAVFAGDPELIHRALDELGALGRYRNTVPRGAQTWEVPLHTPDILAAAHLVHVYTLGYELTGDWEFLAQARYWAWTGVPFVYLTRPTPGAVGLYSTIPVLGATGWVAPVWIGLPVQWCGVVYAEALYRLADQDPDGPWKQLADGIAISGIQQTWPPSDSKRQGLLPDSFQLRAQIRNPPPINPATVLLPALEELGEPRVYDFRVLRRAGLLVHAPGAIRDVTDRPHQAAFTVCGWRTKPYWILVNGCRRAPAVKLNGQATPLTAPQRFDAASGRLILQLRGRTRVDVRLR